MDEDEDPVPMNFDDDSSPFDKDKPEPDEPETSNAPAPSPPPAPAPFRVLKYGGREIPISSQEEYDRIAMAGIEAEHLKAQVTPYAPYIVALQQDPEFERHIASLIEARRRGEVPTEQPKAEELDQEPEQGDDETFDEYEGLSPRTRGNRSVTSRKLSKFGSIPAHAGEPSLTSSRPRAARVYPRARGGTACRTSPHCR